MDCPQSKNISEPHGLTGPYSDATAQLDNQKENFKILERFSFSPGITPDCALPLFALTHPLCPAAGKLPLPACEGTSLPSSCTVCIPARAPFLLPQRKNSPLPGNCSPSEVALKRKIYRIKFTISLLAISPKNNQNKQT